MPGWIRVLGTLLGALIAYIYLKIWPFSILGMLGSVFALEMLCMLLGVYKNDRISTITLLIILLVSQMTPHISPAENCLLRFFESVVGVGVGIALVWLLERWNAWNKPRETTGTPPGETVNMDTMPLRRGHFRVLAVASLGQVTGAGLATLVGIILPMIQLFRHPGLTSFQQGAVAATSLVGIMIGSMLFGAWSDKRGYLFFFRFCPALILAASLFAYFSDDLFGLVAGLFFMGLGIGGGYSLDSDYISEIMPRRWKLLMVGVAKAASSLGNILVAGICFFLLRAWNDPHDWNRLLLLVGAMAAVMLLCRIRFEQSPDGSSPTDASPRPKKPCATSWGRTWRSVKSATGRKKRRCRRWRGATCSNADRSRRWSSAACRGPAKDWVSTASGFSCPCWSWPWGWNRVPSPPFPESPIRSG